MIDLADRYAYAWMKKHGLHDEDIIGAARAGVADAVDTFDKSCGLRFEAWAWRCIHRAIIDEVRRKLGRNGQRNVVIYSLTDLTRPGKTQYGRSVLTREYKYGLYETDCADDVETADTFIKFCETLPEKQRRRFMFHVIYGCGPRRMAEYEGVTEGAVSIALKRSKDKFKSWFVRSLQ